jgi:hypothetical protein
MLGIFGVLAQSQAHQAAFAQQCRYEAEHRAQYRTPEQHLYALAGAHAREQRNSIRGRTWKCGPWTWET